MIAIGQYNDLKVVQKTEKGLILTDGDKEVLLPYHLVPATLEIGGDLNAFVYTDKDGSLLATTKRPSACVGDFAFLTVIDATDDGVFMDLGIDKDIYVPNREQKRPMFKGDKHVVYVFLDDSNDRMVASSRLTNFIEEDDIDLEEGDEVSLLIVDRSDLGFNAIIESKDRGKAGFSVPAHGLYLSEIEYGYLRKT